MKPYPNTDVDLTVQPYGTTWLMVLKGSEENINLVFNGLYNFCATGGKLDFTEQSHTTATFWSSREQMERFFENLYFFRNAETHFTRLRKRRHTNFHRAGGYKKDNQYIEDAQTYAKEQCDKLRAESTVSFNPRTKIYMPMFSMGTIKAERPDHDFKDAVLTHAFTDNREVQTIEKELTND